MKRLWNLLKLTDSERNIIARNQEWYKRKVTEFLGQIFNLFKEWENPPNIRDKKDNKTNIEKEEKMNVENDNEMDVEKHNKQYYKQKILQIIEEFQSYWEPWNQLSEIFFEKQRCIEKCLMSIYEGKKEKIWEDEMQQFNGNKTLCHILNNLEFINGGKILDKLIWELKWFVIKENWNNLHIPNYDDMYIVAANKDYEFAKFILKRWKWFTEITLKEVLRNFDIWLIWEYLENFQINHQIIAMILIESRNCYVLCKYFEKFQLKNHQELAVKIIESGGWYSLCENIEKFQIRDYQEIALKLVEMRCWYKLCDNLEKFPWVDHQAIVDKLIEVWEWKIVLYNKEKFSWVDRQKVSEILCRQLDVEYLLYRLKKLKWMHQLIIDRIDLNNWMHLDTLGKNIRKVECLLSAEVAEKMCENKRCWDELIEVVAKNEDKFESFNPKIAEIFILSWYQDLVSKKPEKFWLRKW